MTIILFHGLGSSKKLLNYIYDGKTYNKNDFIKLDNLSASSLCDKEYKPSGSYFKLFHSISIY